MVKYFLVFVLLLAFSYCHAKAVESIDEADLLHMIKGENPVVVLFTKKNCEICDRHELVLEKIQADLKSNINADVVKISTSPMVSIYDPTKEPAIVMFRKGIPLLYHGSLDDEEMLVHFTENADPVVRELSDLNFEHLTQAATGATTGDWFIYFYSAECTPCQRLYAIWEAVAANLKRRMNVARVNRKQGGIATARRFKIEKAPDFIFIRQGKFYRYKPSEYTPAALIEFADGGYLKQSVAENVPALSDPMGDLKTTVVKFVLENQNLVLVGSFGLLLIVIVVNLCAIISKRSKTKAKKEKEGKDVKKEK